MLSILLLYFRKEVKKDFIEKLELFRLENKSYFDVFYQDKWYQFNLKCYFDNRIFKNFKTRRSCIFGLVKIFFFAHIFLFVIDCFFILFYLIEFFINLILRFIFFLLGSFFYMLSDSLKFLAFEKRKYMDYEKLQKSINNYLWAKKLYKKKGKLYFYLSGKIDPNEKAIKSFLRKKKLDIRFNYASIFFLDLANTFNTDIKAYLSEDFFFRRKSYKRWASYLYLLIISVFYYFSRMLIYIFKRLVDKQLYSNVWEYIKVKFPGKIKKLYLFYKEKWRVALLIKINRAFQYIYRFLLWIYIKFLSKIRSFILKFLIPFGYMSNLKKVTRRQIILHAKNKHKIEKKLCQKYNLSYIKVLQGKNESYKHLVVSDYFLHRMWFSNNAYFTYLEKYILDKYTGNCNFKLTYTRIFLFNLSRYYIYLFKYVWPHVYATLSIFLKFFFKICSVILNILRFILVLFLSIVLYTVRLPFVLLPKIIPFLRIIYWIIKSRKKK